MNNVANAVGPLVAAHVLTVGEGTLYGGLFVALGALYWAGAFLKQTAKRLRGFQKERESSFPERGRACHYQFNFRFTGSACASHIIFYYRDGNGKNGGNVFHKQVVKTMLKVWVVSPFLSLSLSYMLVSLLLKGDYYALIVVTSVLLASVGTISLMRAVKKHSSVHEQGGGI